MSSSTRIRARYHYRGSCHLRHGCILHDTIVGDGVIGMLATLLHHSVVGERCMIGAGAVVREGFEVPSRPSPPAYRPR